MTGATTEPSRATPSTPVDRAPHRDGRAVAAIAVGVAVLALLVRYVGLGDAYGTFVDEITYLELSRSVAAGAGTSLYGAPFFLHPPAVFVLGGAYLEVASPGGDVFAQVEALRLVPVACAAITTALLFLVVRRVGGTLAGLGVAVVHAVDPFALRITSRVLLEATTGMFIVGGYLALLVALEHGAERRGRLAGLAAGVLFGAALLSKEPAALFTVLPVLLAAATRVLPWRTAVRVVVVAAATYLPYPLWAAATGQLGAFVDEKLSGVLRLGGALQLTGFNTPGSVSFVDRLVERLDTFAATYVLLALGAVATVWLLRAADRRLRLLALWSSTAYAYAGFSIVRGTLEEQFFYYVLLPALVVTVVAVARLATDRTRHTAGADRDERRHVVAAAAGVATAVHLVVAGASWIELRTVPDDALEQLVAHLASDVEPGAIIAVSAASETAEFVLDGYAPTAATSVAELRAVDADYAIVSAKSIADGTTTAEPALLTWLEANGEVVFATDARTTGRLELLDLRTGLNP